MKTYTVFGWWHTIRQADITVRADSPEEALAKAKEDDDWIGYNEECDNSDGPTNYEVHEGYDFSTPVLYSPSHEQRLNEAAPELVELLDNTAASLHTMLIHFGNQLPPEDQRAKRVVLKAAQDAVKKLRVGS